MLRSLVPATTSMLEVVAGIRDHMVAEVRAFLCCTIRCASWLMCTCMRQHFDCVLHFVLLESTKYSSSPV